MPAAGRRTHPPPPRAANAFVRRLHRHSRPTVGAVIAVAVVDTADQIRGVAIAGRPVAQALQDGLTLEILRVCTDGSRNACSMLYGACRRAARALGYQRILTYTLPTEGWPRIGRCLGIHQAARRARTGWCS